MLSINTNAGQMTAVQMLDAASGTLRTAQNAVATGQKVASAKDDGATFAMAQNLRGTLAAYSALSGSYDHTISLLDTTTSGLQSISDLLIEMKKVATEAADTSLDSASRSALDAEYQALKSQIDTIADNASFQGQNLISSKDALALYYGNNAGTSTNFSVADFFGNPLPDGSAAPKANDRLSLWFLTSSNAYYADFAATGSDGTGMPAAEIYLRYCDGGTWHTAVDSQESLIPTIPSTRGSQMASCFADITIPSTIPDTASEVQLSYGIDAQFSTSKGAVTVSDSTGTADSSSYDDGHPQVLATWTPNGTISLGTSNRTAEIDDEYETLSGADGSNTPLRDTNSGTAGLDGLNLANTSLTSSSSSVTSAQASKAAINRIDGAQQKVQALLQHYADKTKTFESLQKSETAIADTLTGAVGRMTDADMGTEAAMLTAAQIKQQLATQSLTIANNMPKLLLSLFPK